MTFRSSRRCIVSSHSSLSASSCSECPTPISATNMSCSESPPARKEPSRDRILRVPHWSCSRVSYAAHRAFCVVGEPCVRPYPRGSDASEARWRHPGDRHGGTTAREDGRELGADIQDGQRNERDRDDAGLFDPRIRSVPPSQRGRHVGRDRETPGTELIRGSNSP